MQMPCRQSRKRVRCPIFRVPTWSIPFQKSQSSKTYGCMKSFFMKQFEAVHRNHQKVIEGQQELMYTHERLIQKFD
ncbi:hypothetical protein FGO68_gene4972 [Halteria grandinella]|uniref:Uncharacterized protein n=1 Tax=Halteria grandinella TaxID=5974 RepID=A0A8J8NNS9_HALGN|nr:hypothetical protein FGO68_gene4972 [Halteria grandinella]